MTLCKTNKGVKGMHAVKEKIHIFHMGTTIYRVSINISQILNNLL